MFDTSWKGTLYRILLGMALFFIIPITLKLTAYLLGGMAAVVITGGILIGGIYAMMPRTETDTRKPS